MYIIYKYTHVKPHLLNQHEIQSLAGAFINKNDKFQIAAVQYACTPHMESLIT